MRRWIAGFAAAPLALSVGCATYPRAPIAADAEARNIESRSLDDARLGEFVAAVEGESVHRGAASPPVHAWDLGTLTLAALYFHPSLRIARARLHEAEAGVRTARQLPNPTLTFEDLSHSVAAPAEWTISPVVNFLVETAGRRAKRTREARALTQAALEDLTTASWQVRAGVRNGLIATWAAERRLALMRERLDYQMQLVMLLEHRLAVGEASALDVERERVSANQLRLSLLAIEQQAADARTQLAAAVGVPVHALESVRLSFDGLEAPQSPPDVAQLRRKALTGRSDIRSMLAGYQAADAALALQIANQYPNFTLGPGFSFDSVQNRYILLPELELPVFNRNRGPIAEALARREEAAARFSALQLTILEQVDGAAADYRATSETLAAADAVLHDEQDHERRTEQSFRTGSIDRPTLLASRIERSVAQQSEFDALVSQRRALGALEDALQSPLYFPNARWLASRADAAQPVGSGR